MTSFFNVIFTLQFLIVIVIVVAKAYNLFNQAKTFTFQLSGTLFIVSMIAFIIGTVAIVINAGTVDSIDDFLPMQLFKFESFLFVLNIFLTIIEAMYAFGAVTTDQVKGKRSLVNNGQ